MENMKDLLYNRIGLILCMLCMVLLFTGCGDREENDDKAVSQEDMTYVPQGIDTTHIQGSIYKIYPCGDVVYLITNRWNLNAGEDGKTENGVYRIRMEENDIDEISLAEYIGDAQILSMAIDTEENIYTLLESYDERSGAATYSVVVVDKEGKQISEADVTKDYSVEVDVPDKLLVNTEGEFVIVSGQRLCLYDKQCKKKGEVVVETGVDAAAVSKEGLFLCGSSDDKGVYVKIFDTKRKSLGKRYDIDLQAFDQMDSLMDGGNGWDFYYRDNSGIYGYSLKDKSAQKIMDYLLSDTVAEDIFCITITNDGRIFGVFFDESGEDKLLCYKQGNMKTEKEKTVIRIGVISMDVLGGEGTRISNAVVAFNGNSDHYRVDIVDYEGSQTRLNADIATGKQPDILYLDDETMPLDAYMTQGVFEDLIPYYDRDEDIGTGDILLPLYDAILQEGGMYYVSPYFCLQTVVGSKKVIGNQNGWTYDEFEDILHRQKEGIKPFWVQSKNEMLDTLLTGQINDYIDWTTGKCQFDGEEFGKALQICNAYGSDIATDYQNEDGITGEIRSGKILFLQGVFSIVEDVFDREMYQDDIVAVGYPCEDRKGTYYVPGLRLALCANSKEKQGAWEFLKTFMTKEYQGKLMDEDVYIPTREDCYNMWKRRMTATEPYVDEIGQEIQPYTLTGEDVNITGIPIEDMNEFDRIVQNTTKVYHCDSSIRTIIDEEATAYFNGHKSLDETTKIIQNRVTTYVNEIR